VLPKGGYCRKLGIAHVKTGQMTQFKLTWQGVLLSSTVLKAQVMAKIGEDELLTIWVGYWFAQLGFQLPFRLISGAFVPLIRGETSPVSLY
jgi:hypothetical protein